jgi:bacterioferritin
MPVKASEDAEDLLRFDLENENETIRQSDSVSGCARSWASLPSPNNLRQILVQEQDHQIALATALGDETPNASVSQTPRMVPQGQCV